MANEYLYGAYGHIGETVAQSAVQAGTTPVYIGTAPVNLVRDFDKAGIINAPIKITSLVDAQKKIGYSSDWGTFTLCEAVYAHFNNTLGNIGPIYVINVLDPSAGKHRKEAATTKALTFTGGRAEFASDKIILDTLTIAKNDSGNYVEGTDYAVDYNFTKGTVIITSLKDDAQLTGNLTATFYEVDDSVEDSDIIGGVTSSGEYSGLSAIALLYPEQFAVCNLIAAPGWSHSPAVYNAMLTASQKINGHWDAFVVADLPLVDSTAQAVDTITKAIAWKKANAFTGERSKVYWPQGVDNLGNVYHLSTMAVVELMRADFSHNSVPMETCGNKAIPIIKQYFGANANNRGFDQQTGKELTQNGISTAVAWGGEWVLWGDHNIPHAAARHLCPAEAGGSHQAPRGRGRRRDRQGRHRQPDASRHAAARLSVSRRGSTGGGADPRQDGGRARVCEQHYDRPAQPDPEGRRHLSERRLQCLVLWQRGDLRGKDDRDTCLHDRLHEGDGRRQRLKLRSPAQQAQDQRARADRRHDAGAARHHGRQAPHPQAGAGSKGVDNRPQPRKAARRHGRRQRRHCGHRGDRLPRRQHRAPDLLRGLFRDCILQLRR